MTVQLEILLQVTSFKNKWPRLKIYNNNELIDDTVCTDTAMTLTYNIQPQEKNILKIEHYNKAFGENRTWDSSPEGELKLKVLDIKFNDVSIGNLLNTIYFTTVWAARQLETESSEFLNQFSKFISSGDIVFNGFLEFNWNMPIYDFLIEKKFKESYNSSLAYYSNKTELFHYDQGEQFLKELKVLIKQNE